MIWRPSFFAAFRKQFVVKVIDGAGGPPIASTFACGISFAINAACSFETMHVVSVYAAITVVAYFEKVLIAITGMPAACARLYAASSAGPSAQDVIPAALRLMNVSMSATCLSAE